MQELRDLGTYSFTPPFKSQSTWVIDSRKNNLCKCANDIVAKGLADYLNGVKTE